MTRKEEITPSFEAKIVELEVVMRFKEEDIPFSKTYYLPLYEDEKAINDVTDDFCEALARISYSHLSKFVKSKY